MVQSIVARLVSFVPQTLATLVLARLIITIYGVRAFSAFSLMLALIYLLPIRSLGVGVAVTSALATEGPDSPQTGRVMLTATRVLVLAALVTGVVAAGITAAGLWPRLLGAASGPNLLYGIGVIIFAVSVIPGLAEDILLGLQRNHVAIIGQGLVTAVVVALVGGLVVAHAPWQLTLLTPPVAMVLVNSALAWIAGRTATIRWGAVLRRVPRRKRFPGASVLSTAGPMLVISIMAPIATQMDRIILSHVATSKAVAAYALTMQLFAPAVGLVNAAAQPLWPTFVAANAEGRPGPSLPKLVALFAAAGVVGAAVLVPVSRILAQLIGAGRVDIGWSLPLAGAAWIVLLAVAAPIISALMNPAGLRRMAVFNVVGLPVNLVLSVLLARHIGAAGPLWASVIVTALPLGPFLLYAHRVQLRLAAPSTT